MAEDLSSWFPNATWNGALREDIHRLVHMSRSDYPCHELTQCEQMIGKEE